VVVATCFDGVAHPRVTMVREVTFGRGRASEQWRPFTGHYLVLGKNFSGLVHDDRFICHFSES
jgi:hypothetical protein